MGTTRGRAWAHGLLLLSVAGCGDDHGSVADAAVTTDGVRTADGGGSVDVSTTIGAGQYWGCACECDGDVNEDVGGLWCSLQGDPSGVLADLIIGHAWSLGSGNELDECTCRCNPAPGQGCSCEEEKTGFGDFGNGRVLSSVTVFGVADRECFEGVRATASGKVLDWEDPVLVLAHAFCESALSCAEREGGSQQFGWHACDWGDLATNTSYEQCVRHAHGAVMDNGVCTDEGQPIPDAAAVEQCLLRLDSEDAVCAVESVDGDAVATLELDGCVPGIGF